MFNFLKKNGTDRQSNGQYQYPNYNQQNPYMQNQSGMSNYDMNILDIEVTELKRQINDLYKRMYRLESYLGVRQSNDSN